MNNFQISWGKQKEKKINKNSNSVLSSNKKVQKKDDKIASRKMEETSPNSHINDNN